MDRFFIEGVTTHEQNVQDQVPGYTTERDEAIKSMLAEVCRISEKIYTRILALMKTSQFESDVERIASGRKSNVVEFLNNRADDDFINGAELVRSAALFIPVSILLSELYKVIVDMIAGNTPDLNPASVIANITKLVILIAALFPFMGVMKDYVDYRREISKINALNSDPDKIAAKVLSLVQLCYDAHDIEDDEEFEAKLSEVKGGLLSIA